MFLLSFLENFIYKKVNELKNRNFHSSILFFISTFTLFLIYFIFYEYSKEDFNFLYEWKFYLLIILELLVFYLYRENYHQNKNNFTMINMFVFSTIYLMPILAFFYNPLFSFDNTLDIKYDSVIEVIVFSSVLFILSMVYYLDKIKNKEIKNLKLLIFLLFTLLNTMYFSVKTIQTFNGFLVYGFIHIIIALYFLILSKKETKDITAKRIGLYLIWPFLYVLYFFAAGLVAVEFITIFKRISQIISAMILDKKIVKKDAVLIFLIIIATAIFYFYKH